MRLIILASLFSLAACTDDKNTETGISEESDTDTDTDADTDTDTDTDTDADTDADADTDTDTDTDTEPAISADEVDPSTLKGGEFLLNVAADFGLGLTEDACPGWVTMTNDGGSLTGSVTCEFQGDLALLLSGKQKLDLTGTISGTDVTGSVPLDIAGKVYDVTWTGTYDSTSGAVLGSFTDAFTVEAHGFAVSFAYSGGFHATTD